MGRKYAQCWLWIDIETTGLPNGNDFSDVHILEVAALLTDFDLKPFAGYHNPIKLTREAVEGLKANPEVLKMHKENGLIEECKSETTTLFDVESEIIKMLQEKTTFDRGEFMIAGSGVAAFDFPLIKDKLPGLAQWLAYYPLDIGILRRGLRLLGGNRDFVNPTPRSYQDGAKAHRAWDDVQAHVEEAGKYAEWLRAM